MERIFYIVFAIILMTLLVYSIILFFRKEIKKNKIKQADKAENDKAVARYQAHMDAAREQENTKRLNRIKLLEETAQDKDRILEFEIAGLYYRPSHVHDEAGYLNVGDMLDLKLNPSNEYDSYAVKIMTGNIHLGFIPELYSEDIFTAIRKKEQFIVIVTSTDKGYIPHIRVKVFPREDRRLLDYL